MTPRSELRALLIGIDEWQNSGTLQSLSGCVNDVSLIADVLRGSFGVADSDVQILRNEQATRAGIIAAIRTHLVAHAKAWREAGCPEPPPAYLLHYSGHGSRAYAGRVAKMTRYDETIVPHDSRQADVVDIRDFELGELVDELAGYCDNVTVVLDCCHSGSGLRDVDALPIRRCRPDDRPELVAAVEAGDVVSSADRARTRSGDADDADDADDAAGPTGFRSRRDQWVLFASCQFDQAANETRVMIDGEERKFGLMSYALAQELASLDSQRRLTNRELWERISARVRREKPHQWPQCEGQRDRPLFGHATLPRDLFLRVVGVENGRVAIDGGQVHGLAVGVELDLFPATAALAGESEPVGRLSLMQVGATQSSATRLSGEAEPGMRVAVDETTCTAAAISLAIDASADTVRQPLLAAIERDPLLSRCTVRTDEAANATTPADLTVHLFEHRTGDRLKLRSADGCDFLFDAPLHPLGDAVALLRGRVGWLRTLAIEAQPREASRAALVDVRVRRVTHGDGDGDDGEPIVDDFPLGPSGEVVIEEERDGFAFEVVNRSEQPLYLTLLHFGYDGAIDQLLPATRGERLLVEPGEVARTPGSYAGFHPDDGHLLEAVEHVKGFATREPVDYEVLLRDRAASPTRTAGDPAATVDSPLGQLLREAALGSRTRYIRPMGVPRPVEDWGVATASFRLVRSPGHGERELRDGRPVALPAAGVSITAPPNVRATVEVVSAGQRTRAAAAGAAAPSPAMADAFSTGRLSPFVAGQRSESGGDALRLCLSDDDARAISAEQPLRVAFDSLAPRENETALLMAIDEAGVFPCGRGLVTEDGRVEFAVDWLPATLPDPDAPTQRGLMRSVSLFVWRTLGSPTPSLGLRVARFCRVGEASETDAAAIEETVAAVAGGEVRSRRVQAGEVSSGERVVLLTHDLHTDTRWMVAELAPLLCKPDGPYDRLWTFDYDSLGDSVTTSGQTLAVALKAALKTPLGDDAATVDIVAHGMGGLVARTAIESFDADGCVDRCLLVGVPQRGTVVANLARLLPHAATLLFNATGISPAGLALSWLAQSARRGMTGLADLRTDSELVQTLAASPDRGGVAYAILAGVEGDATDAADAADAADSLPGRLLRTLGRGVGRTLDVVFQERHDLLVGLSSQRDIGPDGVVPASATAADIVPCGHFEYFTRPEPRDAIGRWIERGQPEAARVRVDQTERRESRESRVPKVMP